MPFAMICTVHKAYKKYLSLPFWSTFCRYNILLMTRVCFKEIKNAKCIFGKFIKAKNKFVSSQNVKKILFFLKGHKKSKLYFINKELHYFLSFWQAIDGFERHSNLFGFWPPLTSYKWKYLLSKHQLCKTFFIVIVNMFS